MVTIIGIIGVIIFIGGAYFMGNKVLDTFGDGIIDELMASFYGVLLWAGIGVFGLFCYGVYYGICALANAL